MLFKAFGVCFMYLYFFQKKFHFKMEFSLFETLVTPFNLLLPGDQILALSNSDIKTIYQKLQNYHNLKNIIRNHIIDKVFPNTIQMISGAVFPYIPDKSVDEIELGESHEIDGVIYISFGGILLTDNESDFNEKNPLDAPGIRELYRSSQKILKDIQAFDRISFIYIMNYITGSTFNDPYMHTLKGNWRLENLDERMIVKKNKNENRSDIDLYFDQYLQVYFDNVYLIKTKEDAVKQEPVLKTYLNLPIVDQYRHTLVSLQRLITSNRTTREIVVYHGYGSKNIPNSLANNIEGYHLNEEIIHWSFLSTSFDPSISLGFAGKNCCMMEITIPENFPALLIQSIAKDGDFLSGSGVVTMGQAEIVLPAGLIYKVTNIRKLPDKINTIQLKIVGMNDIVIE